MSYQKVLKALSIGMLFCVTLSDDGLAQAKKDPCDVAMGSDRQCSGADCAYDPQTELDGAWQRVATCVRPLRNVWKRLGPLATVKIGNQQTAVSDVVRNTLYRAMTQGGAGAVLASDPARFVPLEGVITPQLSFKSPVVSIAQLNDRGQPYSSMSQTGLGRLLFGFAVLAKEGGYPAAASDQAAYLQLARASIQTVLTPVSQGGLATTGPCADNPQLTCSWFHAVTRKDLDTAQGATLNKHLHAVRDLILILDATEKNGFSEDPAVPTAIEAGLNQLFFSRGHAAPGSPPNFANFIVTPGRQASWAYYGFNPNRAPPGGAYFLDQPYLNCWYHYHVIDLMAVSLSRLEETQIAKQARTAALACTSPLRQIYLATISPPPTPDGAPPQARKGPWCSSIVGEKLERNVRFLNRAFAQCAN